MPSKLICTWWAKHNARHQTKKSKHQISRFHSHFVDTFKTLVAQESLCRGRSLLPWSRSSPRLYCAGLRTGATANCRASVPTAASLHAWRRARRASRAPKSHSQGPSRRDPSWSDSRSRASDPCTCGFDASACTCTDTCRWAGRRVQRCTAGHQPTENEIETLKAELSVTSDIYTVDAVHG